MTGLSRRAPMAHTAIMDATLQDSDDSAGAAAPGRAYEVLARKYRPRDFRDLIGHGPMVRTLENAFTAGRVAHAYILTGVRGVGKTTTARILARALNYQPKEGPDIGPTIHMAEEGIHCKAIAESRHPDVIEMDAASRTGVGDIRELIEGVRYAPSEARYKVYIIDEVHMLSTAAFNALLKTLEEPPPHVKFIFATTEIRKLPVTVLSRCQRFDLRRIDPAVLSAHLEKIAALEGAQLEPAAIEMIARAAEGSVRDALSIMDQAIVQHGNDGGIIPADSVRAMLGLADRSLAWSLLEQMLKGNAAEALSLFRDHYDAGAEPAVVLRDLLELVHLLTRIKAAGPNAAGHGPAGSADAERAKALADGVGMGALTRAWSLLMKGLDETRIAPDPLAAGEMAVIRICFASDLPTPDEALRMLKKDTAAAKSPSDAGPSGENGPAASLSADAAPAAPEPAHEQQPIAEASPEDVAGKDGPVLSSLNDIARLASAHRDHRLRTEIESYIHLVAFAPNRITLRFADGAPSDLANRLTRNLKAWTGQAWTIIVDDRAEGQDTLRALRRTEVENDPVVQRALALFPGARIERIRDFLAPSHDEAPGLEAAPEDDSREPPTSRTG